MTVSSAAQRFLERVAATLDIPEGRYEAAARSYASIGKWLSRPGSSLAEFDPSVYPQGSFRLGTVIRPVSEEEHYDLDVVCELNHSKSEITQERLKRGLGLELAAYAEAHRMKVPAAERYCWTMDYADGAQFQMDVLPALPDGDHQRLLIESRGLRGDWAHLAVGITDTDHPNYRVICRDWSPSNPRGYSDWFRSRMREVFEARRRAIALSEGHGSIEKIPEYRVKTPLQVAVQILKRHRDLSFTEKPDLKPASIIITTLAAHAYQQERDAPGALYSILSRLDHYIEDRNGISWIENPSDPRENFADRWAEEPDLRTNFMDWLQVARTDFTAAGSLTDDDAIADTLAPRLGRTLMERTRGQGTAQRIRSYVANAVRRVLDAPHRQPPQWPVVAAGSVRITGATATRNGFQPKSFNSDGLALPKRCSLKFEADTNVQWPYEVYWQIVNTGDEARAARSLRGSFEPTHVERGRLTKIESTLYSGTHSIECFVVKNRYCVARSGPFIVNIE